MIKATVNQSDAILIEGSKLNDTDRNIDIAKINDIDYHVLIEGKSYRTQLVSFDANEKKIVVLVNGSEYEVAIEDSTDLLLKKLGLNNVSGVKNNSIKAPMPGLIKQVLVAEGQSIKKGDVLLILEAMKMENALKAAADGEVKRVTVNEGEAVEKGQLLISLA